MRYSPRNKFWRLDVSQETIPVPSMGPLPDESWRFTDSAGHSHYWNHGYPTLSEVVDDYGWDDIDNYEYAISTHYECPLCEEAIQPGTRSSAFMQYINGMVTYSMSGRRSDGAQVDIEIDEDDFLEFVASGYSDEMALRLLDAKRPLKVQYTLG